MYEVSLTKNSEKTFCKLSKEKQKHIIAVLERARIRPEKHFERLVGTKSYKLRARNYSIIADIRRKELRILVIKIGHRKNIYKK